MINVLQQSNTQQRFTFALTELIESSQAYGSNVDLTSYKIINGEDIEGKFRDSWNDRIFSFIIKKTQLGHKPAVNLDSFTETEPTVASKYFDSFSAGYTSKVRLDRYTAKPRSRRTEKAKCTSISYSCGRSCISLTNHCWIDGAGSRSKTVGEAAGNSVQDRIDKLRTLAKELKSQPDKQAWSKYGSSRSLESKAVDLERLTGRESPRRKGIDEIDPANISVDPKRFQYKIIGEITKTGSVGSLGGVKKWDENLAGIIQVWEDKSDKKLYVVNGHNRLDLAKKTGVGQVTIRYLQAESAKEARGIGALTNIAEGRGTALDAAKFFRDSGLNRDELEEKGISLKDSIANNGLALADLSEGLFSRVMLGSLSESRAIAISKTVNKRPPTKEVHNSQEDLLKLVENKEKTGRNITNEVIEELAILVQNAPKKEEEQGGLLGLLGFAPEVKSLAIERATLQASIKKRLAREAKLFGTVGKSTAAEQLKRAGNQINVEESSQTSAIARKALQAFGDEVKLSGVVNNLLNDGADKLASGKLSKKEEDKLYDDILARLRKTYLF